MVLNRRNNTSGARGVFWTPSTKKWRARIGKNGEPIHLGYFRNSKDAVKIYNRAAKKYYGEFAALNPLR